MTNEPNKATAPAGGGAPIAAIAAALRQHRQRSGLSMGDLAARAGVAKSTLSQLESGSANPSVETLWSLATALGVPFSALVDPPAPAVRVLRAGEGPTLAAESAHFRATLLAASTPGVSFDVYRIAAEPGPPRNSEPHATGTVEHLVIATGRALAGILEDPVELGPGDYVAYPADLPHTFHPLEPGTTAVMVSQYR
ncbi:helix-turn-helix domain-containing protein [Quadrisphaera setariae]|uniref:Helix-turn-helix transcriptional regulator n=1 Tax=Quadrisphaera setariae TaxID=2593304 RepID=A0A5C8ZD57_9ACTN|nr:XRE family transcriptional regulator [Quadrisphaera setariae]TXR56025.1 helix-turn-helix transcriptional regulator [Quadrisphaera setariae]